MHSPYYVQLGSMERFHQKKKSFDGSMVMYKDGCVLWLYYHLLQVVRFKYCNAVPLNQ